MNDIFNAISHYGGAISAGFSLLVLVLASRFVTHAKLKEFQMEVVTKQQGLEERQYRLEMRLSALDAVIEALPTARDINKLTGELAKTNTGLAELNGKVSVMQPALNLLGKVHTKHD